MTSRELAAALMDLAREARSLQHHLARLLQAGGIAEPETTRRLEDALLELESLTKRIESLARFAEAPGPDSSGGNNMGSSK